MTEPRTFGDLKNSRWAEPPLRGRTVRDEIRANLMARLASGETLFPGIVGYEDTIMPQIVNALLARHNFILLGLRGQAKSRILRELTGLLDDRIPIVAGSEVNDNPFAPISKYARDMLGECGDATPIAWLRPRPALRGEARHARRHHRRHHRRRRSDQGGARRAPALRRADDALRPAAARQSRDLRDQRAARPRGKVQVGLFNIMQEGDVQIKGYPVRLPLDVLLCFTANPEDYTARGKIITPLKDRIGSEIITHYPADGRAGHGDHRAGGVDRRAAAGRSRSPTSCWRWSSGWRSRRGRTSGSTSARA